MTRRVAVFTSSRADFGPLGPVVCALDGEPLIELLVIATGTHMVEAYGGRVHDIELSSRSSLVVLDVGLGGTHPAELAAVYGKIATGLSRVLSSRRIDVLVLLGDRWELLAAAGTALIHGVPIAHLHGGETTEGAIDERIRHGITKLSDLHLCATDDSARRIRSLGEEAWRIIVTGAPGLDRLRHVAALPPERLTGILGRPMKRPFGVIVYHPTTVERRGVEVRARSVFDASAEALGSALVFYPGADPGSESVISELEAALDRHPNLSGCRNLGDEYPRVLKAADVLIGNSSSGIIEAASLRLPVVDVGDRQRGRLRPRNVIHVGESAEEIARGIRLALAPCFRQGLAKLVNPYGRGDASQRIVRALRDFPLDRLISKPRIGPTTESDELERLTIRPGASLREVMATIDRGRSQIAFVTERGGRLVGSISDGDVRRALLGGAQLDDTLDPYVNRIPVVAAPSDGASRVLQLMDLHSVSQVPVVDEQGKLVGVHLMRAVIGRALDQSPGRGQS